MVSTSSPGRYGREPASDDTTAGAYIAPKASPTRRLRGRGANVSGRRPCLASPASRTGGECRSRARSRIEAALNKTPDCLVPALLARASDEPRRKDDPVHEHWSYESLDVSRYDVPSPLEERPRASCTLERKAAPH